MKKKYITPEVRVRAIDTGDSMMAASTGSEKGFVVKENDLNSFIQKDATDGSSVKGSEVLAKPMFGDDSENQ